MNTPRPLKNTGELAAEINSAGLSNHSWGTHTKRVLKAVESFLDEYRGSIQGRNIVVGCSGGGDSLALCYALSIIGVAYTPVCVDHQLQEVSSDVADRLCDLLEKTAGCSPIKLTVTCDNHSENAARMARYSAIANHFDSPEGIIMLTGHTKTDQAEGVLIGLSRGSGTTSIAGMRSWSDNYWETDSGSPGISSLARPLLSVSREDTYGMCEEIGVEPWEDPTNGDGSNLRSRIRGELIPLLEEFLGSGIADRLSRTAEIAREDADELDRAAERRIKEFCGGNEPLSLLISGEGIPCDIISRDDKALGPRVIRMMLNGVAGQLSFSDYRNVADLFEGNNNRQLTLPKAPEKKGDGKRMILKKKKNRINLIYT